MKPTVPPIQFTKGELQMIDKGIDQFFKEWLNGYESAGRVYMAGRIREKVRSALADRCSCPTYEVDSGEPVEPCVVCVNKRRTLSDQRHSSGAP